ncbi:MAG TPA: hypothetical protein VEJ63_14385 [Planctomycetota bacterium]|nr:hypothetical protein [Planctomycetota bacterium]
MIGLPLSLNPGAPQARADAWFVPGSDAQTWLDELNRWQVSLASARLFILPTSQESRTPEGVLVVGADAPTRERLRRAQPYCRIGTKLFIPADAELQPAVEKNELDGALPFDTMVLHPAIGLIGFRAADALSVSALLSPPSRRDSSWSDARPGASPYPRLISVEPDTEITIDGLFGDAKQDIGSQSPESLKGSKLGSLASQGAMLGAKAALGGIGLAANAIGGLAGMLGGLGGGSAGSRRPSGTGGGGGSDFLDSFAQWANGVFNAIDERLQRARNQELSRLLNMLERNPDEGLKFAIPLAGGGGRGVAAPGSRLTARDIDFRLGGYGGLAVDAWDIPENLRWKLREQYIAAANRELSLGRYRRAAYIFAELLGDDASAANALKQGRHYREAAVIYRDILKNKVQAAECLEEGGLLLDAIAIRTELKQWMEVARLYEKLHRFDEARDAYEKAVAAELQQSNLVGAAKILEEKLTEPERALQTLAGGWPSSKQAKACLENRFALLGRLGRHGDAAKAVHSVASDDLNTQSSVHAIEVLQSASGTYPDTSFRVMAADAVRVMAGQRLPGLSVDAARTVVHCVWRLAREDRLLERDVARYIETREKQQRAASKPAAQRHLSKTPVLLKSFKLPPAKWMTAASADADVFYAAGTLGSVLVAVRGGWDGTLQPLTWSNIIKRETPILLEVPRLDQAPVVLALGDGTNVPQRNFPSYESIAARMIGLLSEHITAETYGLCFDESGRTFTCQMSAETATLSHYTSAGKLQSQHPLGFFGPRPRQARWVSMAARDQRVFLLMDSTLIQVNGDEQLTRELPSKAVALAISAPFTRLRIAVSLENGGVLFWPQENKQEKFAVGLTRPAIGFTRGGELIAATKEEIRIYQTESARLQIIATTAGPGHQPVSVLPATRIDEYALILENGDVQVFRISILTSVRHGDLWHAPAFGGDAH